VNKILIYPNKVLKECCEEISIIDDETKIIIENLLLTYKTNKNCLGIAAPQLGFKKRIIVVDSCGDNFINKVLSKPNHYVMINPKIISHSENLFSYDEGCLSFPGVFEQVKRPKEIVVEYRDINFQLKTLEAKNILSTCIQHEIDHLDGIMFFERVSQLRKTRTLQKYKRLKGNG